MDALKYLQKEPDHQCDCIYIAPPQFMKIWKETMYRLDKNPGWLKPGGKIIVQIDVLEYSKLDLAYFAETEQRKYGDTLLIFYTNS